MSCFTEPPQSYDTSTLKGGFGSEIAFFPQYSYNNIFSSGIIEQILSVLWLYYVYEWVYDFTSV